MDDTYSTKVRASENVHERARYLRGRFLNTVAVIEHNICTILTEFFCTEDEEKRALFFSEIAGRMSLNAKKDLLVKIVYIQDRVYIGDRPRFLNLIVACPYPIFYLFKKGSI